MSSQPVARSTQRVSCMVSVVFVAVVAVSGGPSRTRVIHAAPVQSWLLASEKTVTLPKSKVDEHAYIANFIAHARRDDSLVIEVFLSRP
jgi:hypothetical protein